MPTYEYVCDACGHEFEEVQKISDPPIDRCPKCKKRKAHRLISQGNFILKGGGWYVTDYKGGGKKRTPDKDGAGASEKKDTPSKDDAKPSKDVKKSSGDD